MSAPTMADFQALQEQVAVLQGQVNAQAAFGLNPFTNQATPRFRRKIDTGDYVQVINTTTETTIYSVTFEPLTFAGNARGAFVSLWGDAIDGDAGDETYILRLKLNGTTRIADTFTLAGLNNQYWRWDTRFVARSKGESQMLMSEYRTIVSDGTLTTGNGSWAGPTTAVEYGGLAVPALSTIFGDFAQPNTISFTVELGAADTDLSFTLYSGITELV